MNDEIILIAIKIIDRIKAAVTLQESLSKYNYIINTRFGHHELNDAKCSRAGLIILELRDNSNDNDKFIEHLETIEGISFKVINFKK